MLADKDLPAYVYGDLKREELVRTRLRGPPRALLRQPRRRGGKASGTILDLIKQGFGSYETWEAEFRRTAGCSGRRLGLGGAGAATSTPARSTTTGRGTTCTTPRSGRLSSCWTCTGAAYHIDFGAAAARYVDAFMENVNWEEVSRRAEWARKAARA